MQWGTQKIFLSVELVMNISKTLFFRNYKKWNMLDSDIQSSESLNVFKRIVLKFIQPKANSSFNCLNLKGVKLITRLRLGLSNLRDHKCKHSFQDFLNRMCSCGIKIEATTHYLLHCPTTYMKEQHQICPP